MDHHSPVDTRSRPRFGIVGLLFVLTFLAGLAVAAWGARRFGWFLPERAPAMLVRPNAPAMARPAPGGGRAGRAGRGGGAGGGRGRSPPPAPPPPAPPG